MGTTPSKTADKKDERFTGSSKTASPRHRKLQTLLVNYLFETDPDVLGARKECPVSEKFPADICVVRKDSTEVVEVEPNIEPYIRIDVAVNSYGDARSKFQELEGEGLVNENFLKGAKEKIELGKYNFPEYFRFVPKGDLREARKKLESKGWRAEESCRMNKMVRKYRNMDGGADKFSLLIPYHGEAALDTFVREIERYDLPVFRIYLSSENGDGITGFREIAVGGNRTCQK